MNQLIKMKTLYDNFNPDVLESFIKYYEEKDDFHPDTKILLNTRYFVVEYDSDYDNYAILTKEKFFEVEENAYLGYFDDKPTSKEIIDILKQATLCESCNDYRITNDEKFSYKNFCYCCSTTLLYKLNTDETICSICLENLVDFETYKTKCNHYFHTKCIKNAYNNKINRESCPLCRCDLSIN
jgi:hypothetical protein